MAKSDASQKYFTQAINLFTEIKAPNQVDKISITASF